MRGLLRAIAFLLALAFIGSAGAQSVVASSTAQALIGGGTVYEIAAMPDGRVVIGGSFTFVNGVARNNIARLNADGTVDLTWNPNANNTVLALAVDGAGNVYAGGSFTTIGGQNRNYAAMIPGNGNGAADPAWSPGANDWVTSLVLDGSGSIFAGGYFTTVSGQTRTYIAKLSASGAGTPDLTWNAAANSDVYALARDAAGNIYAGGFFTSIGGQARNRIAKLLPATGAADPTWNPNSNDQINSLAISGASLYAGGFFSNIGGQNRARIAKLSTGGAGAADAAWNPGANGLPASLAVDGSGSLYASGDFTTIGGQARNRLARLSASGAVDSWNPNPDGRVNFIAIGAGGLIHVGGEFAAIGGQVRHRLAALSSATGTPSTTWPMVLDLGTVNAIVRDGTGRMVIGGAFQYVATPSSVHSRSNIARLNADGSLDTTWDPDANASVLALAIDAGDSVFAGGDFTVIGDAPRAYLAKLLPGSGGVADATWNPNPDAFVHALALDASGSIYAGGAFFNIGGQGRQHIARLSTSGTGAAASWNPNADLWVFALAVDSGSVYAGGMFQTIGGQTRRSVAKLSTTGSGAADANWNPGSFGEVRALVPDGSGNLYVGGGFSGMGGQSRQNLARVSTSGFGLADAWNPGPDGLVSALQLDGGGGIYVGGTFAFAGGQFRNNLARLSTSGAGAATPAWNAGSNGPVTALALDAGANLCVGGTFELIAAQGRASYACVTPATVSVAPTITSANAVTFTVGSFGSFTVTATGTPTPTRSVSGTLPAGVSFNTGTGVLSGTPGSGMVGSYPLTFSATNSQGTANQNFTLTVAPTVPGKPTITSLVAGNNQATVNFTPPADNGGSPIVSYKARCSDGSTTVEQTGAAPPIVVTGLTNGVAHTCTVSSTNGVGEGPQSDPSGVTPGGGGSTPPTTNLGSLAFGGQSMGTTSPATELTITNPNASTITITGIALTSQFGQSNNCTVLVAQASCKVFVTFSPAVFGGVLNATVEVTGTLTITTSAGNLTVNLGGTAEKSLVTHYYRSILRRAPDGGGHAFWSGEAARVAALGANVNETWFALAATFYRSGEYVGQNRNVTEYVRDLYNTFYNRAADDGGLTYWTGQINAGLPREVVLLEFMFSAEFASFTGAIFGNANVRAEINTVVDFYRGLLGRLPDGGGFNFWVGRFRTAQCQGATAVTSEVEAISSAYALSAEYGARGRDNTQYVTDLYNAFLRRGGDLGGVQHWINQIASGTLTREQLRVQFKNSAEFQGRVNAIINQGCMQ